MFRIFHVADLESLGNEFTAFLNHDFFQRPLDCELTSPDVVHTCFPVKNLTMNNSFYLTLQTAALKSLFR